MNYAEAIEYLDGISKYGSIPGLERIRELLGLLGDPQKKLRFVHVAGTNGKGSVCAFLSSILKSSGYTAGVYTSPAVFKRTETISVSGRAVSQKDFAHLIERVDAASRGMEIPPTVFEAETAAAFLYFKEKACDIVVLECGLGGAEDATSVIDRSEVAVLTSISLDHRQILGKTIREIAEKKAGIIKGSGTVVTAMQDDDAMEVIRETAKKDGVCLMVCDADHDARALRFEIGKTVFDARVADIEYKELEISLMGSAQIENALVALGAAHALKDRGFDKISERSIRSALKAAVNPGRFELISKKPCFVIDGAHNPDAALVLKESIGLYFKNKRLIFITGVFADKDYETILRITAGMAESVITVHTPRNGRALPAYELALSAMEYNKNVTAAASVDEAVELACLLAGGSGVIVAFGSLSFLGRIKKLVKTNGRI